MGRPLEPDGRHAGLSSGDRFTSAGPGSLPRIPSDPRAAAFRILEDVEAGAYADRAAEARLGALAPRDRALAMELAYGCIRLRARLDAELVRLSDRPLPSLDRPILIWLRLGLYQIRETRIPDHAALFESVEGARRAAGRRSAGFVNAVLRAALRGEAGPDLFPPLDEDPVGHLATRGSHPAWLVRRWLDRWPVEDVARLVELDNRPPPVTVRLLAGWPRAEAAEAVARAGIRLEPIPDWPNVCVLAQGEPTELLKRFPAVIQDPAASAVVEYAGSDLEGPVVDLAAAPGTKALGVAWQAPGARPYLAADISPKRLAKVLSAAAGPAGGAPGPRLLFATMDGRRPAVANVRTALLDVPCAGTGVLRRRPDARWRLGPERLRTLVRLQRELLDGAAGVVAPGGRLVYSTCSLEPEENEDQVEAFLQRRDDFVRDPAPGLSLPADVLTSAGDLFVRPWIRGTDGAYAARLRRRSAA